MLACPPPSGSSSSSNSEQRPAAEAPAARSDSGRASARGDADRQRAGDCANEGRQTAQGPPATSPPWSSEVSLSYAESSKNLGPPLRLAPDGGEQGGEAGGASAGHPGGLRPAEDDGTYVPAARPSSIAPPEVGRRCGPEEKEVRRGSRDPAAIRRPPSGNGRRAAHARRGRGSPARRDDARQSPGSAARGGGGDGQPPAACSAGGPRPPGGTHPAGWRRCRRRGRERNCRKEDMDMEHHMECSEVGDRGRKGGAASACVERKLHK